MLTIDFLYTDDCPHCSEALITLKEVLSEEHVEADFNMIRVASEEEAEQLKFLGSPTIRMNGEDVEPEIEQRADYHGHCRLYVYREQVFDRPPKEMIREALKKFL
jgi:glutaredoxin